jgi:hypothetical protein
LTWNAERNDARQMSGSTKATLPNFPIVTVFSTAISFICGPAAVVAVALPARNRGPRAADSHWPAD